jgi:hypothetical protein
VAVCDRKPSPPLSYWCKASVTIVFLFFFCVHLSAFMAPNEHRRRNDQALQQPPLQFLYPLRGRSIVRLFLCDVRCFSVPKSHALSEASLQCSCDRSVVCREALLLFHLLSQSFSLSSRRPTHTLTSFIVHTKPTAVYASKLPTISPSFNRMSISAILESTLVLPSVAPNLQLILFYPISLPTSLMQ